MIYVLDRDVTLVNDVSARSTIGAIYEDRANGKRYVYALYHSGCATVVAGQSMQVVAAGITATTFTVTNKANGGLATVIGVGCAAAVVTAARYGFVQVYGYNAAAVKEAGVNTITIGTPIYPDANDDSVFDTAAAGPIVAYTVAASDDTANTVPVFVSSPFA